MTKSVRMFNRKSNLRKKKLNRKSKRKVRRLKRKSLKKRGGGIQL